MDLSGIDLSKVGEMLAGMSEEDMSALMGMASQLSGDFLNQEAHEGCKEDSGPSPPFSFGDFDPEMLFRIMRIFEKLNSKNNDPGCNLIYALKPLLSPERRRKADMAAELLRLMSIFSSEDF